MLLSNCKNSYFFSLARTMLTTVDICTLPVNLTINTFLDQALLVYNIFIILDVACLWYLSRFFEVAFI